MPECQSCSTEGSYQQCKGKMLPDDAIGGAVFLIYLINCGCVGVHMPALHKPNIIQYEGIALANRCGKEHKIGGNSHAIGQTSKGSEFINKQVIITQMGYYEPFPSDTFKSSQEILAKSFMAADENKYFAKKSEDSMKAYNDYWGQDEGSEDDEDDDGPCECAYCQNMESDDED